jgi:hypothetical protein
LKMSGVCLDLITDPLMYNMIELGTRGGISMIYFRSGFRISLAPEHQLIQDEDL